MNSQLFESAEFYKRRYGSFSVYLVIPAALLLCFLILFSMLNKKEITVQSIGELVPTYRLAKIQSTSDLKIIENNLLNHQYIEKGQTLIVYSGQVTETEIQTMITQLAQLDKQIMDLETLKQGIVKDVQTFVSTDEFGYQSSLGSYLSQREVMQKEHDKVNANISLQNETVVSTQKAINDEITALTAKIAVKKNKQAQEKDKERQEAIFVEIEQLETNLASLKTQKASSGTYQSYDESLASKLNSLKTEQLANADKELVIVKGKKQEIAQSLSRAREIQQNHEIIAPESGIIKVDESNQHKKMIPIGTMIAEILPSLTDRTKLEIEYYVDSSDLTALKIGQKIRFASTKKFKQPLILTGRINSIAKSATQIKGQNFFQVKAQVTSKTLKRKQLIYGLQGRVSSVVDTKTFFQYYLDKFFDGQ
ncbi:MAG: HlyD family efflux transporter periplasmic adaptor subunit [Pseudolactococcus laudensis]